MERYQQKFKEGKEYNISIRNVTAFQDELDNFIFKKVKYSKNSKQNMDVIHVTTDKKGIRAIANFIDKYDKNKNAYISIGTMNIYDPSQRIDDIEII